MGEAGPHSVPFCRCETIHENTRHQGVMFCCHFRHVPHNHAQCRLQGSPGKMCLEVACMKVDQGQARFRLWCLCGCAAGLQPRLLVRASNDNYTTHPVDWRTQLCQVPGGFVGASVEVARDCGGTGILRVERLALKAWSGHCTDAIVSASVGFGKGIT